MTTPKNIKFKVIFDFEKAVLNLFSQGFDKKEIRDIFNTILRSAPNKTIRFASKQQEDFFSCICGHFTRNPQCKVHGLGKPEPDTTT